MSSSSVTRGFGFLEGFLANQRSKVCNRKIPSEYRKGRVLDIGCGTYPLFLMSTKFSEKYGLDKIVTDNYLYQFHNHGITLINQDIQKKSKLPFDDEFFDVVTMLAVIEHIEPEKIVGIVSEICRILRRGGILIVTTPAFWTNKLLKFLSVLRLVSPVEIDEHKIYFTHQKLAYFLQGGGFENYNLQLGYFEVFMNIWATAMK